MMTSPVNQVASTAPNTAVMNQQVPVQVQSATQPTGPNDQMQVQNVPTGNPATGLSFTTPQGTPNWGLILGIGALAFVASPLWLPLVGGIFQGVGALATGAGGGMASAAPHVGSFIVNNAASLFSGVVGGAVGYGIGYAMNPPQQSQFQAPATVVPGQNGNPNGYAPY